MTWQVASFTLLAFALAAGFGWYERTHPSAKVLALVATLAALAVLGRIAFAPLPNVKPTMALILVAGYVLGAAPGFAVGAVTALASNMFFGQGPFTPWQMVGFGALGLLGAGLARAAGPDLGRFALAAAAGAAGFALGAFLDFSDWVLYTDHTLAGYLLIAARGIPFDVALAAGNVVFCLAFGPALVRSLRRFRDRFEVTWHPAPAAAAGLAAVLALAALTVPAPAPAAADAADRAARYLVSAQVPGGGFAAARGQGGANAMHSGWAAMALAAYGRDLGCRSPATVRFLRAQGRAVRDTGDMERTLLALRAQRQPGGALAARLLGRRRANGSWEGLVNATSFAVLALRAAGRPAGAGTLRWLARQQNADGGFNFGGRGGPSGIDDTAAAVQALVAGGRRGAPVRRAATWLAAQQRADGGFPLSPGAGSNAQSTAFAVQGLIAAGRDPDAVRRDGSRTPLAYLRTLQAGDGSVRYSRTSRQTPTWVTAQALLAFERAPLPVAPVRATRCPRAAAAPRGGADRASGAAPAPPASAGATDRAARSPSRARARARARAREARRARPERGETAGAAAARALAALARRDVGSLG
jgi:energy-coupling factor transport system substrate-specific component